MKAKVRIIFFGLVTGMIWAVILCGPDLFNTGGDATLLFNSGGEAALFLLAGALTGLMVSLALRIPVSRSGPVRTVIAGLISLPLGACIFGAISSLLDSSFHEGITGSQYGFFTVLIAGGYYALLASATMSGVILFPLAVLTTFIFRAVIRSGQESGTAI